MIAKVFPYVILFLWGCAFPACASDEILSGLSENKISITTSFTGSELLVFGSIKRDTSTSVRDSDVIIEIIGPELPITVRKKRKVLGIWVNTDPVKINDSPSFYAILHTNFPELILEQEELRKYNIGAIRQLSSRVSDPEDKDVVEAIIRIKKANKTYQISNDPIELNKETLFSASLTLPANLIEGDYRAVLHLVQDKRVVDNSVQIITVSKIGVEKWLYEFAYEKPFFYGIFSIILALILGWGGSVIFRKIQ